MKNISPVKELRESIGVSQRELADALGVHHTLIANLEMNAVNMKEDDEETISKTMELFDKLSRYSGIPKKELINRQLQCTKKQKVSVREEILKKIPEVVGNLAGVERLENPREADLFLRKLDKACLEGSTLRSPLQFIREVAGITQRQLAQAVGVSQTMVARIESGELSFAGLYKGYRILCLIMEGLGIKDMSTENYLLDKEEISETMQEIQEEFMNKMVEANKQKVEAAFQKLQQDTRKEKE